MWLSRRRGSFGVAAEFAALPLHILNCYCITDLYWRQSPRTKKPASLRALCIFGALTAGPGLERATVSDVNVEVYAKRTR